MDTIKKMLATALLIFSFSSLAMAQDDLSEDDAYDPFADYSEFEASADEEADIHFFKNGRFFNIGLMFGGRMFTQTMGDLYSPNVGYGFYFSYFFDIRSAIQVSYTQTEHKYRLDGGRNGNVTFDGFTGNVSMYEIAAHYKYYFNTANVTRGFADLNPFVLGGFGMNYRTIRLIGEDAVAKSSPVSVDIGAGLEVPIARKKMYLGFEVMYHYVTFPDENDEIIQDNTHPTGVFPNGDYVSAFAVLGINF